MIARCLKTGYPVWEWDSDLGFAVWSWGLSGEKETEDLKASGVETIEV